MQKLKNFIKFLWDDLYNKSSVAVVNIYNLISAAWIAFIYVNIEPHQECLGSAFGILLTLLLNIFIYFICHIIFVIQTKKNRTIKDNPIIKSWLYRVICIISICVVCVHYLLFAISIACITIGQLFL